MNSERDQSEDSGEHEVMSWWRARFYRTQSWIVRLRQQLALAIWISDGRLPGGAVDLHMLEEGHAVGDEYTIMVRYAEGATVRLRGACTRDRTRRLTGFMSIHEEPYYQILAVGGARLDVDTSKGPLVGQAIATVSVGVGVGVLDRSIMIVDADRKKETVNGPGGGS